MRASREWFELSGPDIGFEMGELPPPNYDTEFEYWGAPGRIPRHRLEGIGDTDIIVRSVEKKRYGNLTYASSRFYRLWQESGFTGLGWHPIEIVDC